MILVYMLAYLGVGFLFWALLFVGNLLEDVDNQPLGAPYPMILGYLWLAVMFGIAWPLLTIPVVIDKLCGNRRRWYLWPKRFWRKLHGRPMED